MYIGSLKYYAKLFARLSALYDVSFLLIRRDDRRRRQMVAYLERGGYPYEVLDNGLNGKRVPFLGPIVKRIAHERACRNFLKRTKPVKVVVTKNIAPHDILVREANRLGIETILLQWAYFSDDSKMLTVHNVHYPLVRRTYYWFVDFVYRFISACLHRGSATVMPRRVGAIDEKAAEGYKNRLGFDPGTIRIVGLADFQIVSELKREVATDSARRASLFEKYILSATKQHILVFAQAHHLRGPIHGVQVTKAAQVSHYRSVIEDVRSVFPATHVEIILKLHPSDDYRTYTEYQELGVKIFGDEAVSEELICLSDLCVSIPWSSVNYSIVASATPAIFANFSKDPLLQERNTPAVKYYGGHHVVTTPDEFITLLKQFKAGHLKMQYDGGRFDTHSLDHIIEFIGT
jgi:hypothetical protein